MLDLQRRLAADREARLHAEADARRVARVALDARRRAHEAGTNRTTGLAGLRSGLGETALALGHHRATDTGECQPSH